ncbi:MAG: TatD family hydrolase [Prevotella sp.]|nr:TatD family hydrolase [Bacteroides sp.]MCM1366565.1 TatD family hydrolase [Prevotella sp.]MCM1437234.1 TatD family hydrolase [Prevotella sp.]
MIDTHTHIYLREDFEDKVTDVIKRALGAGVRCFVFPNIDQGSVDDIIAAHINNKAVTKIAAGLHPTEVREDWRAVTDEIFERLSACDIVAVGEVGIDLYWDRTYREVQMDAFEYQLYKAYEKGLPAIIHCREGLDEVLEVFRRLGDNLPVVVFHSFTYGPDAVEMIRDVTDAYFGINGVVTFKNASEVRESVKRIGLERILLETDSPYLAPVPHRGKRNESCYLGLIRDKIAEVLGVSSREVEDATDRNAVKVFGLDVMICKEGKSFRSC